MRIILTAIILLGLIGCEKSGFNSLNEDSIIGSWSNGSYTDSLQTFKRVNSVPDDDYSISFLSNGKLTEIKNSGWCGTPPIAYGEFTGSWEFENDTILVLNTEFWGGTSLLTWRIIEINDDSMTIYLQEYENIFAED